MAVRNGPGQTGYRESAFSPTELDYTEQTSWMLFLKYLDDLEYERAEEAVLVGKFYRFIIDEPYRWSAWAAPRAADGQFDHDTALTCADLIAFVNDELFPYLQGFRERATGPDTIEYKIGEIFSEIRNKFASGYSLRDALELIDGLSFRSQKEKHELSHLYEAKIRNMGNAGRNGGEYYTPRPLIRAMVRVVKPRIGERIFVKVESIDKDRRFRRDKFAHIDDACHRALSRSQLRAGDILFSIAGALGRVAEVRDEILAANTNQALAIIRLKRNVGVSTKFLIYALSSTALAQKIERDRGGVAQQNLSLSQIKNFAVPLPPLPEQKRIVAILDEAFAGIATAVANTEKNLANARELFESYLNTVFNNPSEGLEVKRLTDVADHCLGKMLDKTKNKGMLRPYLRNINVRWFQIDTSDMLQMRIEDHEVTRYSVERGDLLICEGGYPGRAAIWDRNEPEFFQKALHRVRCSDSRYNRWILYYLYFQDSIGELRKLFTGAGIQHPTGKVLANLELSWPPAGQLDSLLAGISVLHEEVTRLEVVYAQKLAALESLKQSLLQKAFSGELTANKEVSNAIHNKEEVA